MWPRIEREVTCTKKPDASIGLMLRAGVISSTAVIVDAVEPGSSAADVLGLVAADELLEVNGQPVEGLHKTGECIKRAGELRLRVRKVHQAAVRAMLHTILAVLCGLTFAWLSHQQPSTSRMVSPRDVRASMSDSLLNSTAQVEPVTLASTGALHTTSHSERKGTRRVPIPKLEDSDPQAVRALLRRASCSRNASGSAMSKLSKAEATALQWMFAQHANGSHHLPRHGAFALMHHLRKLQGASVSDQDFKLDLLLQMCAPDRRLILEELALVMTFFTAGHVRRAVALYSAEQLRTQLITSASSAKREPAICRSPLLRGPPAAILNQTRGQPWRYYSAFRCARPGCSTLIDVCLSFKDGVLGHRIKGLCFKRGRRLRWASPIDLIRFRWDERMLSHNHAILQLPNKTWMVAGGMESFATNVSCRRKHRFSRSRCLAQVERTDDILPVGPRTQATGPLAAVEGMRITTGAGWAWSATAWDAPRVSLRGSDPPGCVDRRPEFTGFPWHTACEFDGRFSLVRAPIDGSFRLYARSNLKYGALTGGRYVQTTRTHALANGSWERWTPVQLLGVNPAALDLYFFAVQINPVHPSTFMALMPVAEPPWACIAIAFSRDGVRFSRPLNLRDAPLAFRKHSAHSIYDSHARKYSARSEDHPVANMVFDPRGSDDPNRGEHLLLYIHHAVKGITYRDVDPYVAAYRVRARDLLRWTRKGLGALQGVENGAKRVRATSRP